MFIIFLSRSPPIRSSAASPPLPSLAISRYQISFLRPQIKGLNFSKIIKVYFTIDQNYFQVQFGMSTSKSFQNQQAGFVSYRPNSPKLTTNSPSSTSTNQNQTFTNLQQRGKQNSQVESDHFATIRHENSLLREENKALKRELNLVKGEFLINQNISSNQTHSHEVNDLRETIKKEAGQIKQLKTRLEVVSKQCKMYEEIIDKMEGKINKLTDQNKQLEQKLKESRISDRHEKEEKIEEQSKYNKEKFGILIQKVNQIATLYNELESRVQLNDKQWEMWKEQWGKEKSYYLNRIRDLEGMMGIGVEAKEFYKKRY